MINESSYAGMFETYFYYILHWMFAMVFVFSVRFQLFDGG